MPSDTAGNTLATANVLVSLIIRGDSKNKKRLALDEGFKILESGTRIIHDTNTQPKYVPQVIAIAAFSAAVTSWVCPNTL